MKKERLLKTLIENVNSTLIHYEDNFTSVKRTPNSEKERITSFKQFIEARFNFECCFCDTIPNLKEAAIATEGHIFLCTEIEGANPQKKRFTHATLTLLDPNDVEEGMTDQLREWIQSLHDYLKGTQIQFNSVKKKIKVTIIKDK